MADDNINGSSSSSKPWWSDQWQRYQLVWSGYDIHGTPPSDKILQVQEWISEDEENRNMDMPVEPVYSSSSSGESSSSEQPITYWVQLWKLIRKNSSSSSSESSSSTPSISSFVWINIPDWKGYNQDDCPPEQIETELEDWKNQDRENRDWIYISKMVQTSSSSSVEPSSSSSTEVVVYRIQVYKKIRVVASSINIPFTFDPLGLGFYINDESSSSSGGSSSVPADSIIVSGAGSTEFNGIYQQVGEYSYQKIEGNQRISQYRGGPIQDWYWYMSDSNGEYYYISDSLFGTWSNKDVSGALPAPTVALYVPTMVSYIQE